ncbi:DNA helicase RecQ [Hydrogenimonas sp.]
MTILGDDVHSEAAKILESVFGHTQFRPLQKEAVEVSVEGRDLLMILPTGGGKSLCYQLPALLKDGVTVVISPLLALMHDQVCALKLQGISAEMIGSMQSAAQVSEVIQKVRSGDLKLLYVAPERFAAYGFIELLQQANVASFVIDEAHCVSEWGHEFREDYRKLHLLKEIFPQVPIAAFTATATPQVEKDIMAQLAMENPLRLRGSVFRKNLLVNAKPRRGDGKEQLLDFISRFENESGIVYTFTRNSAETIAAFLQKRGIKAMAYHARLPACERQAAYHAFIHDEVDIIVATVAFGMGIDKSNIRYVVHMSMPKTLENYYQEIGRAGRDGLPSETMLFYSATDAAQRASLIEELEEGPYRQSAFGKLEKMIGYCRSEGCRHVQIAEYFGESMTPCRTHCDNCTAPEYESRDITTEAKKALSAIYRTDQRFGKNHIIDLLRGSKSAKISQFGHDRLSVYGIGSNLSRVQWEVVFERLLEVGALARGAHRNLAITAVGVSVLKGKESLTIRADRMSVKEKPQSVKRREDEPMECDREIFEQLRMLRKEIADENGVPAYIVFGDRTLKEMAVRLPQTKAQMLEINGVAEVKYARFGEVFLSRCQELSKALMGSG